MRLINAHSHTLEDFTLTKVPPYAILSHTWGQDEVSYQDMSTPIATRKRGYHKIQQTCELAISHNLEWAWVDTCCIDKTSSAELTESINSMFRWYQGAAVCFVWLEDLEPDRDVDTHRALSSCRWLTRGWCLQELLAPANVLLYDSEWRLRGSKNDLAEVLSSHTKIPLSALRRPYVVASYSIAARMSWAARRETTRPEDMAYCLLGLFGVNMPLIYGEGGEKAFRRLQEEIVKRSNDLTIFAWQNEPTKHAELLSVFASSPRAFSYAGRVTQFSNDHASFSASNRGLLMAGGLGMPPMRQIRWLGSRTHTETCYLVMLGCQMHGSNVQRSQGGIVLCKISPTLFCRDSRYPLMGLGDELTVMDQVCAHNDIPDYYILIDPANLGGHLSLDELWAEYRESKIYIPKDDPTFKLDGVKPEDLWDVSTQTFLKPSLYDREFDGSAMMSMTFSIRLDGHACQLQAICRYVRPSQMATFLLETHSSICAKIDKVFDKSENDNKLLFWDRFVAKVPETADCQDALIIDRGGSRYYVSLSFQDVPFAGGRLPLFSGAPSFNVLVPRFNVKKVI